MTSLTILTATDVDKVLDTMDLSLAVKAQAAVFGTYSSRDNAKDEAPGVPPIQLPQRHILQSPEQSMLFMPARVNATTTIKIVSVPKAGAEGLPATTLVMDEKTGRVVGVVNARKLTAVRNAAGSVLSMELLNPNPTPPASLVVFGSGAQADAHVRAFVAAYPTIKSVTIVARRSTPRATAMTETLGAAFPQVKVTQGVANYAAPPPAGSEADAAAFDLSACVRNADIICTMTSSEHALYAAADAKPGSHHCLVGSYKPHMREVEDDLIAKRAGGVILVDSREACGHEAGELQNISADNLVEIGDVVNDNKQAERVQKAGDLTVFKSVGLGVQDVAISKLVYDEAGRMGLGVEVDNYD